MHFDPNSITIRTLRTQLGRFFLTVERSVVDPTDSQPKMNEQIIKKFISNFKPVNSGLCGLQ